MDGDSGWQYIPRMEPLANYDIRLCNLGPTHEINTKEFQYYFNGLLDYEVNEWVTVTQPLNNPTAIYPDNHDGVPANGLDSVQIGLWEMPGALNIEIGGIYVNPINPTPTTALFEWNSNNAKRAWRWGAFDDENSTITLTDTSIMLDIQPAAGGDWPDLVNGDRKFGSGDMVAAFAAGGYEKGLRPATGVNAVPEPSGIVLVVTASRCPCGTTPSIRVSGNAPAV